METRVATIQQTERSVYTIIFLWTGIVVLFLKQQKGLSRYDTGILCYGC